MPSTTQLILTLASVVTVTAAFMEMNEKRAPLGTMRFGKRAVMSFDDNYDDIVGGPAVIASLPEKRSSFEETERSIRAPLGTMRFGKRTPLGTMRFGKRFSETSPFGTMRFGKRMPLGTMRFGK